MKIRTAFLETWTESEAGWGSRSDGATIHLTREDYKKYIERYWSKMPDKTPSEYVRNDSNLKEVVISESLYKKVKKSEDGIRLWDFEVDKLKENNEILYKG